MYSSVSNNFKTECKRDVNAYKRIAKIHVVEDNIDITNDDDLVEFTIEEMAYSENTFVGNSVAKKISLKIINDGSYNLENKEIGVYVGIDYVGDGSNVELIPYGNFIISKPLNEEVKDTSNYVGYDYMIKTEVPFTESNIVYPISLYNYLSAICTSIGITLGNQSIPNGDYQILGNAYTNGENIRQIIEEIARCCGGFAVIGRNNKLYIRTLNTNILPAGYQQVEYIESNGTQYIDTGVIPNTNTKIDIQFETIKKGTYGVIFGGEEAFGTNAFHLYTNFNNFDIGFGARYTAENIPYNVNTKYTLVMDKTGLTLNDTTGTFASNTITTTNSVFLFAVHRATNVIDSNAQKRIYYCKLYDNGTLVRNLIPCYRISDNVIGMYDLVDNVFYTNAGSGTFAKGNDVTETITPGEYFEDFGTANTYGPVNRVAIALNYNVIGEDTIREDPDSIVQNGLTEIRVSDISFLNSEAQRELVVDDFWESLHGLTYKPYSTNYYGYPYVDAGDIVKITKPDNTYFYSYILNHKFTYNGAFSGNVEAPALSDVEDEYKQTSTARSAIRNTELRVDKINGEIQSLIEEIGDRSDKQTTITQDIDRIELTVEDLEDLTYEVDGMNPITLEECVAGEILTLRIRGNNTVFDGLRPSNTLVPSNTLYPYGDSFLILKHYEENEQHEIVETIERIDLKITQPLRYMSANVFDEFRYDYDAEQKARVIRRIGLTNNGEMYALAQEVIEPVDIDDIVLTQGTNIIDIGAPYQANVYADYVKQNQFTKIFTTQYQVSTQILQLANQISLIVSEKVGKDEIVAEINLAVEDGQGIIDIHGNQIKIKSDYFELTADGQIVATSGKIAGFDMWTDYNSYHELRSWLTKNFTHEGNTYRSGMLIRDDYNTDFIFAGMPITSEGWNTGNASFRIINNGTVFCKRINMNGESGYVNINFDSGKRALWLGSNHIYFYIDDENNGFFGGLSKSKLGFTWNLLSGYYFTFYDYLHNQTIASFNRQDDQGHAGHISLYMKTWYYAGSDTGYEIATKNDICDKNVKKNIKKSDISALDRINKIEFKQFDWDEKKINKNGHVDIGIIAQQVKEIDENYIDKTSIRTNDNEITELYSINVLNMLTTSMKAIQELNEVVKKQQEDIDYLKEEIKKLKGEK